MFHRIANKPMCCSLNQFEAQVKLAKKTGASLTFDDGLKEHYTVALPILKKYGLKGLFFIITNAENKMVSSHKIWFLLERANDLIRQFGISKEKTLQANWYVYDSPEVANLKYYLNTHQNKLDEVFSAYFDERKEIPDFYMNWDEIAELNENGMIIGSHTHTHPLLAKLSNEKQEDEIKLSTNIIARRAERPVTFAYPLSSYNDFTLDLLKKYGYKLAVTCEPENPLLARRIDTNEFH